VPADPAASASSSKLAASARTPPPPVPTETVQRPDRGLARGVWEAPPTFFYLVGAAAFLAAAIYVLARRGFFNRLRTRFFPRSKGLS